MTTTLEQVIAPGNVVFMNYRLVDDADNELDATRDEPLSYLHGHRNIIPGLENALTGLKAGDKKEVIVTPGDGYGERQEDLRFRLPITEFGDQIPKVGSIVELEAQEDSMLAHIIAVDEDAVTLDGNHPMAGKTLHFTIEVISVRPATSEELEHGHSHDGHNHHH